MLALGRGQVGWEAGPCGEASLHFHLFQTGVPALCSALLKGPAGVVCCVANEGASVQTLSKNTLEAGAFPLGSHRHCSLATSWFPLGAPLPREPAAKSAVLSKSLFPSLQNGHNGNFAFCPHWKDEMCVIGTVQPALRSGGLWDSNPAVCCCCSFIPTAQPDEWAVSEDKQTKHTFRES